MVTMQLPIFYLICTWAVVQTDRQTKRKFRIISKMLIKIVIIVNMLNLFLVKTVLERDLGLIDSIAIYLRLLLTIFWVNYY